MTLKAYHINNSCGLLAEFVHSYDMGVGVAAFSTTRHGGCSTGNYASFNINRYCGDDEQHIVRNRKMLSRFLGVSDDRLIMPHQTHQTDVALIDETFLMLSDAGRQELLEAKDALMTDICGVCIGVSTADCIPVLLYDEAHHAVCAVHAGWRGTVQRIVLKTLDRMSACYGTQPSQVVALIGPGISLDSFEVGDEVYEIFADEGFDMSAISRRYPIMGENNGQKWHIDLPASNRLQLLEAGVPQQRVLMSSVCTFKQSDDFFSARRLGINSGRIFTGIMMS